MTIHELFAKNPDAYAAWLAQDISKIVLEDIRNVFGPVGLASDKRTGESALYYAGGVDTWQKIHEYVSHPERWADSLKRRMEMDAALRPQHAKKGTV